MITVFFQGMGVGAGLIIAIGAQNAFVLTQGIRKQHHWLVALMCSVSDGLLIFLGSAGFGSLVARYPQVQLIAAWGGILFLLWFGASAFLRVFKDQSLRENEKVVTSLKKVVFTTVAITFFNPHVYLDTFFLLGSIGAQYSTKGRYLFALGATTSSFLWFFSLSLGGVVLAPFFKRQTAWKIMDFLVAMTMWVIAYQLLAMTKVL